MKGLCSKQLVNKQEKIIRKKDKDIQYLKRVVSLMPGNVYWIDKEGKCLGCNDNLLKIMGLESEKQILGKSPYSLMPKELAEATRLNDLKIMKSDVPITFEENGWDEKKQQAIYLTQKSPLKDFQGKTVGLVGISVNITGRKKMEEDLRVAKKQAESANQLKTEFILNMEHDLRTPASGIFSMTGILAENEKNPEHKHYLELVHKSSGELLNILTDIVRFREIEDGKFPLLNKKMNLEKVILDVINLEITAVEDKRLEIVNIFDKKIPKTLIGDEFRLQKILINLLSNAVKFTHKGNIKITTDLRAKNQKTVIIDLKVKDTGIGIPEDKQEIIYQKFVRLDPSNRNQYKGTGLGLYLVKKFLDEMGGQISLKSELGKGSIFICTIPFKIPSNQTK